MIGLLGVAMGISGLIGGVIIARKDRYMNNICMALCFTLCSYRPESKGKGDMATEENPAYGLSGPQTEGDYEIPQHTQPSSEAPEERVSTD